MSYYELVVIVVTCCWGPLLNVHFHPGSQRRRNLCILYRLYFQQNEFLEEAFIEYTHANFHHATTLSRQNIAFQIWWLPCNDPKLFKVFMDAKYSGSESFDDNYQHEKPPMGTTGHVYQWPDWIFLSTDRPVVKYAGKFLLKDVDLNWASIH